MGNCVPTVQFQFSRFSERKKVVPRMETKASSMWNICSTTERQIPIPVSAFKWHFIYYINSLRASQAFLGRARDSGILPEYFLRPKDAVVACVNQQCWESPGSHTGMLVRPWCSLLYSLWPLNGHIEAKMLHDFGDNEGLIQEMEVHWVTLSNWVTLSQVLARDGWLSPPLTQNLCLLLLMAEITLV